MRLAGENLEAMKAAALELGHRLDGYAAVYNVIDDLRLGKPQLTFSMAEGAHGLGLSADEVAGQLRAALLGEIADTQRIGDQEIEVLIRQAEEDRSSLDALADMTIALPDGRRVPLEVVANARERREWARITRIDGQRNVTVEANVDARQASGQAIVDDLVGSGWLVDFRGRHPGVAAAGQASRDRLRAILISSTTTIAGLLPLLAETSTQAAAIKPLVISVVFGLLSATLLVLLVIPALYVLFDDWGWIRQAPPALPYRRTAE
ncbi:efflux RND transporter permease subunit [Halomonas sp. HK25]|uniref:efflux RND transporter permease subunit n=1 Tax=Halomonas sp. HK25 TaxID=3394321 RepID=UPI0039FB9AE9